MENEELKAVEQMTLKEIEAEYYSNLAKLDAANTELIKIREEHFKLREAIARRNTELFLYILRNGY